MLCGGLSFHIPQRDEMHKVMHRICFSQPLAGDLAYSHLLPADQGQPVLRGESRPLCNDCKRVLLLPVLILLFLPTPKSANIKHKCLRGRLFTGLDGFRCEGVIITKSFSVIISFR